MAINPINAAGGLSAARLASQGVAGPAADTGFMKVIDQLLGAAGTQRTQANQAVQDLVSGKTEDVHNVALAVSNADITFRLILEIRNRLTDAYQEITRMQV